MNHTQTAVANGLRVNITVAGFDHAKYRQLSPPRPGLALGQVLEVEHATCFSNLYRLAAAAHGGIYHDAKIGCRRRLSWRRSSFRHLRSSARGAAVGRRRAAREEKGAGDEHGRSYVRLRVPQADFTQTTGQDALCMKRARSSSSTAS